MIFNYTSFEIHYQGNLFHIKYDYMLVCICRGSIMYIKKTTHILAYECEKMCFTQGIDIMFIIPSKTFLFFQFGHGWNSLFLVFIFMSVHSVDSHLSRYESV